MPRQRFSRFILCCVSLAATLSVLAFYGSATAFQQEKPAAEKPAAEKPAQDKPAAETPAKEAPAKEAEVDVAASGRATARPIPATPVDDRSARTAARTKGDITFDDLKFDIAKGGTFEPKMLSDEVKDLDKKSIRLRGYILPASVFQESGIKKFVLVRDNLECCFGPGAALYDCVIIEMAEGKSASFTTRPVAVKGKFTIETEAYKYPDGGHYAIYKMVATEVR